MELWNLISLCIKKIKDEALLFAVIAILVIISFPESRLYIFSIYIFAIFLYSVITGLRLYKIRDSNKFLDNFGYSKETINHVLKIILAHSYNTRLMPKTLEGKILASADAMSHFSNDFYLTIATSGKRDVNSFKKFALEKLNKDYNKKYYLTLQRK